MEFRDDIQETRARAKEKIDFIEAFEASKKALSKLVQSWNAADPKIQMELAVAPTYRHGVEGLKIATENLQNFMHAVWEKEGD